jgi:glycosyltransferase involved in cell wall biosynthesis
LKIAFLIGMLGAGGAERVMTLLCNALQADGHFVSLWTFDAVGRDFYALDPRVCRVGFGLLGPRTGIAKLGANLRIVQRLRIELRSERPDVLVSFITQANVLALLAAIALNTPVVISERIDARIHRDPLPWRALRRVLYRRAACLVVQTNALRPWANELVGEQRVTTIPNPVAPVASGQAVERSEQSSAFSIVAMGRLVRHKGFDLLLQAFALVAPQFAGASLTIYGEGPERDALQAHARRLGLVDRVSFPGRVQNAAEALAAASLFVLSSRYEGFPNVLTEAMSLARPVVAFDCPSGPAEIIRHELDGLLVPAEDVQALAAAMTRVLSDAELRKRIALRAAEVNERFSQQRVLEQWLRVLEGSVRHG